MQVSPCASARFENALSLLAESGIIHSINLAKCYRLRPIVTPETRTLPSVGVGLLERLIRRSSRPLKQTFRSVSTSNVRGTLSLLSWLHRLAF